MSNCVLGYLNRIDECSFASYGSWSSTLTLTNINDRDISKTARSTDAASNNTRLRFALSRSRNISIVAFVGHNLSSLATWRYKVFSDSGYSSIVYDSGVINVWPQMPFGYYDWWDDGFWSLTISEEERSLYTKTCIYLPTSNYNGRYFQFEFFDTSNTDGYVEIGRIFVGSKYQPLVNMNLGASVSFESKTVIDEAMSGNELFDKRTTYRVARFTLDFLESSQSVINGDINVFSGVDKEVVFVYDPESPILMHRKSFMGRLRSLSVLEQPYTTFEKTSYEIKELL